MKNLFKFVVAAALLGICFRAHAQDGQKAANKHTTKMRHHEGRMRKHVTPKSEDKRMREQNKVMKKGTTKEGRMQ